MLSCENGSIYTGITTDLERRFSEHSRRDAKSAKYTKAFGASEIVAAWSANDRASASRLEYQIKSLKRPQKERLIANGEAAGLDLSEYTRLCSLPKINASET